MEELTKQKLGYISKNAEKIRAQELENTGRECFVIFKNQMEKSLANDKIKEEILKEAKLGHTHAFIHHNKFFSAEEFEKCFPFWKNKNFMKYVYNGIDCTYDAHTMNLLYHSGGYVHFSWK